MRGKDQSCYFRDLSMDIVGGECSWLSWGTAWTIWILFSVCLSQISCITSLSGSIRPSYNNKNYQVFIQNLNWYVWCSVDLVLLVYFLTASVSWHEPKLIDQHSYRLEWHGPARVLAMKLYLNGIYLFVLLGMAQGKLNKATHWWRAATIRTRVSIFHFSFSQFLLFLVSCPCT